MLIDKKLARPKSILAKTVIVMTRNNLCIISISLLAEIAKPNLVHSLNTEFLWLNQYFVRKHESKPRKCFIRELVTN